MGNQRQPYLIDHDIPSASKSQFGDHTGIHFDEKENTGMESAVNNGHESAPSVPSTPGTNTPTLVFNSPSNTTSSATTPARSVSGPFMPATNNAYVGRSSASLDIPRRPSQPTSTHASMTDSLSSTSSYPAPSHSPAVHRVHVPKVTMSQKPLSAAFPGAMGTSGGAFSDITSISGAPASTVSSGAMYGVNTESAAAPFGSTTINMNHNNNNNNNSNIGTVVNDGMFNTRFNGAAGGSESFLNESTVSMPTNSNSKDKDKWVTTVAVNMGTGRLHLPAKGSASSWWFENKESITDHRLVRWVYYVFGALLVYSIGMMFVPTVGVYPQVVFGSYSTCNSTGWPFMLGMIFIGSYVAVIGPITLYLTRNARDEYGIRTDVYVTMMVGFFSFVAFFITTFWDAYQAYWHILGPVGFTNLVFLSGHITSVLIPLRQSFREERQRKRQAKNLKLNMQGLKKVLEDDALRAELKAFCVRDFTVENVMFYEEIMELERMAVELVIKERRRRAQQLQLEQMGIQQQLSGLAATVSLGVTPATSVGAAASSKSRPASPVEPTASTHVLISSGESPVYLVHNPVKSGIVVPDVSQKPFITSITTHNAFMTTESPLSSPLSPSSPANIRDRVPTVNIPISSTAPSSSSPVSSPVVVAAAAAAAAPVVVSSRRNTNTNLSNTTTTIIDSNSTNKVSTASGSISSQTPVPESLIIAYGLVYTMFIEPNTAPLELNLPSNIRDKVKAKVERGDFEVGMYKECVECVLESLYYDTFPKFRETCLK
jgi:hypothetical protein